MRLGSGVELLVVGEKVQDEASVTEKAGACQVDSIEGANAGQRACPANDLIADANFGDPLRELPVTGAGETTALPHFR